MPPPFPVPYSSLFLEPNSKPSRSCHKPHWNFPWHRSQSDRTTLRTLDLVLSSAPSIALLLAAFSSYHTFPRVRCHIASDNSEKRKPPQDRTTQETTMARSSHSSSSSSTPPHDDPQRRQGRRPSTRISSSHQSTRRPAVPDVGMMSSLEDVTDVVLATEYYWSPESRPQPRGRTTKPYHASTSKWEADSVVTSGRRISPARSNPRGIRWGDLREGEYGLSTLPETPQLGRLGTPDLELMRKCDRFCDCCSDEHKYQEDRSKMDSQSRFTHTFYSGWRRSKWLSLVVVRRRIELAHD